MSNLLPFQATPTAYNLGTKNQVIFNNIWGNDTPVATINHKNLNNTSNINKFVNAAKDVAFQMNNLVNAAKSDLIDSDEAFAKMLQDEEYANFAKEEDARLNQTYNDLNLAKKIQQEFDDAAFARMLQEQDDADYAKSLQAIEEQIANDALIARMLQEDGNDSAYALQLAYDLQDWA